MSSIDDPDLLRRPGMNGDEKPVSLRRAEAQEALPRVLNHRGPDRERKGPPETVAASGMTSARYNVLPMLPDSCVTHHPGCSRFRDL